VHWLGGRILETSDAVLQLYGTDGHQGQACFRIICRAGPVQLHRTHVETGSRKQSTQLFYKADLNLDGIVNGKF
jgi:hypothetical protein